MTKQTRENYRCYGKPPYSVVVLHGGPGGPGEVAPVARELSKHFGVLEPLQTAFSVAGQIEELNSLLDEKAVSPITLIGWSWGAMLAFMYAARYPKKVNKLILVSSGVFDEKYAPAIMQRRLERFSNKEKEIYNHLLEQLNDSKTQNKSEILKKLAGLISKVDAYEPILHADEVIECQYDLHQSVWKDAEKLRSSGALLALGKRVQCPVVAIHGDYDPHPIEGIVKPLSSVLKDFRCIVLEKCGHHPWFEKHAKVKFYEVLTQECHS